MNLIDLQKKKQNKQKISMVTCYDFSFAQILAETSVDMILVGDSLAMVIHGHPTTLGANVPMMALHAEAVHRGAPNKFIVVDVPFLAHRKGLTSCMNSFETLMKTGAQAIKIEGAVGNLKLIEHTVQSGIPVMGHLGLTPQSIHQLGGYRVQGKEKSAQEQILQQAHDLQEAGCFALVLECVPVGLAKTISETLDIPTIGIGAGSFTDGQVLVLQDLLGMNKNFHPKFVRKYLEGFGDIKSALDHFHNEVLSGQFPSEKESYL